MCPVLSSQCSPDLIKKKKKKKKKKKRKEKKRKEKPPGSSIGRLCWRPIVATKIKNKVILSIVERRPRPVPRTATITQGEAPTACIIIPRALAFGHIRNDREGTRAAPMIFDHL